MVEKLENYPYSSFLDYIGKRKPITGGNNSLASFRGVLLRKATVFDDGSLSICQLNKDSRFK